VPVTRSWKGTLRQNQYLLSPTDPNCIEFFQREPDSSNSENSTPGPQAARTVSLAGRGQIETNKTLQASGVMNCRHGSAVRFNASIPCRHGKKAATRCVGREARLFCASRDQPPGQGCNCNANVPGRYGSSWANARFRSVSLRVSCPDGLGCGTTDPSYFGC